MPPHSAVYTIDCASPEEARALATSLDVEASDPLPRATVRVVPPEQGAASFRIEVDAEDVATLRAASNSFLKWLSAADASLDASGSEKTR
ncbi:MAG: hypothetical protein KY455_02165 [Euryarchaeota archaeon]|nr:hypothetical protein [Euryarchaeota archaeon]